MHQTFIAHSAIACMHWRALLCLYGSVRCCTQISVGMIYSVLRHFIFCLRQRVTLHFLAAEATFVHELGLSIQPSDLCFAFLSLELFVCLLHLDDC